MANAASMKVFRDLWLHKGRTILVVLAIAAGLAGSGTILFKYALVRQAVEHGYLASNPPAATLAVDRLSPEALARVRALPEIRQAEGRRTLPGSIWIGGRRYSLLLFAADDFPASQIGRVESIRGAWPPGPGELVIERSSLPLAEIELGAEVAVQTVNGERSRLSVSGFAHDVGLAPGWMEHVIYAFAALPTLGQIGEETYLNQLRLTVSDTTLDRSDVRKVAASVSGALLALDSKVRDQNVPVPGEHVHAGQMKSLLYVQVTLGLLALALSGILVVNLMTAVLAGQVREIGIMKSIGGSSWQIARLYLAMVAVMGALANTIAIPIAAIAGHSYAELTASMLNFELSGLPIPLWALALPALVGILFPMIVAVIPIQRGVRLTVSEALRDQGIDEQAGSSASLDRLARLSIKLPRPLVLSIRNTLRRRGRLAVTLLMLAAGGALYIGSLNLRASIVRTVDSWFDEIPQDVTVSLAEPYPADELEQIVRRMPGVEWVEVWGDTQVALDLGEGIRGDGFRLLASPDDSQITQYSVLSGRWLDPESSRGTDVNSSPARELVVNRKWTHDVAPVAVDDVLTLWIDGQTSSWRIVGIVESSRLVPLAYTTNESLQLVSESGDRASRVLIGVDPSNEGFQSHIEMVRQRDAKSGFETSMAHKKHSQVASTSGGLGLDPKSVLADSPRLFEVMLLGAGIQVASSRATQTVRTAVEDHMVMVVNLLWAMSLLVIVVGGFGLATTMSLTVLERTKEIGILRSIGASHGSIFSIVLVEAVVIAIASWIIAVPMSLPMSYLLGSAFGRIMFQTPIQFGAAPAAAALWLGFAVLLATAAAFWPAFRAARLTPREALSGN